MNGVKIALLYAILITCAAIFIKEVTLSDKLDAIQQEMCKSLPME